MNYQVEAHGGLVAFPHGDARNGVWVTSYAANMLDAFTAAPGETAVRYRSHISGHWEHVAQDGSTTEVWPDGSSMVTGNGGVVPETYRHTLDAGGARVRTPLTQATRVPNPPAAMPRVYKHVSGATTIVHANGMVEEYSAAGQRINVGAVGDTLYRLIDERILTYYNSHTHGGVQEGNDHTLPPDVQLTVMEVATQHLYAG